MCLVTEIWIFWIFFALYTETVCCNVCVVSRIFCVWFLFLRLFFCFHVFGILSREIECSWLCIVIVRLLKFDFFLIFLCNCNCLLQCISRIFGCVILVFEIVIVRLLKFEIFFSSIFWQKSTVLWVDFLFVFEFVC